MNEQQRPFGSCQVRGLLQRVCDQPGTSGSTRLVFGAILQAGQMQAAPAKRQRLGPAEKPEPGRRSLPLYVGPQISDERWASLSVSQVRALKLLRQGHEWAALETLRQGSWRNPEEELRQLRIYLLGKRRRKVAAAATSDAAPEPAGKEVL